MGALIQKQLEAIWRSEPLTMDSDGDNKDGNHSWTYLFSCEVTE